MKKTFFRTFAMLMALLMLILVCVACTGGGDDANTEGGVTTDPNGTDEGPKSAVDATGLEIRDYGGQTMNIWYSTKTTWKPYPLDVTLEDSNSGDIVISAGYQRNKVLESMLDIYIDYTESDTNPNKDPSDVAALRILFQAGDTDRYDIIMTGAKSASSLAKEGFYFDLNNSEYIHPDAYYYETQVNEQIQLYGKQYFAAGYYSVMNTAAIDVTFVNYGIVEDNSHVTLTEMYQMAFDKTWTFEKMMTLGRTYATPTDNTGDYNTDKYALVLSANYAQNMFYDLGGTAVEYDDNLGDYVCTLDNTKNQELLGWINTNIADKDGSEITIQRNNMHDEAYLAQSAPFMTTNFAVLWDIMESDLLWSIMPTPLKNEGDDYRSYSDAWNLNFAGIPSSCRDIDKATYLYELFMAYSYDYVYPAYYEKCFQTRYQPDADSAQVFDMVAKSRFVCIANIYGLMYDAQGNEDLGIRRLCYLGTQEVGSTVEVTSGYIKTNLEALKKEVKQ